MVNFYDNSLLKALQTIYPGKFTKTRFQLVLNLLRSEEKWFPWLFDNCPRAFWWEWKNQRRYLDWLADELGMERFENWYAPNLLQLIKIKSGTGLIKLYEEDVPTLLQNAFPEHDWTMWLFHPPPKNFWHDVSNQKKFVDWFAQQLSVQTQEDWQMIKVYNIYERGGKGLLEQYGNSLADALCALYPQYIWDLCESHPKGYWQTMKNQKSFFDMVAQELGIIKQQDWYKLSAADISKRGGSSLMQHYYKNSLLAGLEQIYPEYMWHAWSFATTTHQWWKDRRNQRQYLDWLAETLNIQDQDEWANVSVEDLRRNRGGGLVHRFSGRSFFRMLELIYPEKRWHIWLYGPVPKLYWDDPKHRKNYFEWVTQILKIEKDEDWYKLSQDQILSLSGASTVLSYYGGSFAAALQAIYPGPSFLFISSVIVLNQQQTEKKILPWLFTNSPHGFWFDESNVLKYMKWVADKLEIQTMEDWYKVSASDIIQYISFFCLFLTRTKFVRNKSVKTRWIIGCSQEMLSKLCVEPRVLPIHSIGFFLCLCKSHINERTKGKAQSQLMRISRGLLESLQKENLQHSSATVNNP